MALALLSPGTAYAQTVAPGAVRPDTPVQANATTAQQAYAAGSGDRAQRTGQCSIALGRGRLRRDHRHRPAQLAQRNLDIKRTATGVVDAISAEDIGKFPAPTSRRRSSDFPASRSSATVRVASRPVSRFAALAGTSTPPSMTAVASPPPRAARIDFSTVGSDFIGGISVLKTPDVSLASSSIGATVDIQFPKPFDHPGFRAAVSASGSLQDRSGHVTPTLGALVSDTFADDTIGILSSFIYTRRDTDTNRVFVSGWPGGNFAPCQLSGSTATSCAPTTNGTAAASDQRTLTGWFPQQYGAEQQRTKDERASMVASRCNGIRPRT
jgi:hypothetical protein